MRDIVLIVHDIRSCHNVGSLLRTAEGLGLSMVFITGYAPYPAEPNDERLPHIRNKLTAQIHKTALGAENTQPWQHHDHIMELLMSLKKDGYTLVALEQDISAIKLNDFTPPNKVALILGREVEGLEQTILDSVETTLEIPMYGAKESFNVVQAAAMALYHLRFM